MSQRVRLFTVPYFSVRWSRRTLQVAILTDYLIYKGGGGRFGRRRKKNGGTSETELQFAFAHFLATFETTYKVAASDGNH